MEPVSTPPIHYLTVINSVSRESRKMTIDDAIGFVTNRALRVEENTPLSWKKQLIVVPIKSIPALISGGIGLYLKNQRNHRDAFEIRALMYDSKTCTPYYDRSFILGPSITVSEVVMIVAASIIFLTTFFLFLNETCSKFIEAPFRPACQELRGYAQALRTKYLKKDWNEVLTDQDDIKAFCRHLNIKLEKKN